MEISVSITEGMLILCSLLYKNLLLLQIIV